MLIAKIKYWLFLLVIPLFGCYGIRTIKYFSDKNGHLHQAGNIIYPAIPDSLRKYFTYKEIKEFNKGDKIFWNKNSVQYRYYYNLHNGKVCLEMEGFFYTDAPIGSGKDYYPNGNVSNDWNYILYSDSLKKTIDLKSFNKYCRKHGMTGYNWTLDGEQKSYSEDGKLLKVENYNKGMLVTKQN